MARPALDLARLLACLQDGGFEFIVVGGVAAVAYGASTPTQDLDVVAPLTTENLSRLLSALGPHNPRFATRPDLRPSVERVEELLAFRLVLIETNLGRIDVLREVHPIGGYGDLETSEMELVPGRRCRVIALDQLIETKARLGRAKDRAVEAELRAIRDLLRGS